MRLSDVYCNCCVHFGGKTRSCDKFLGTLKSQFIQQHHVREAGLRLEPKERQFQDKRPAKCPGSWQGTKPELTPPPLPADTIAQLGFIPSKEQTQELAASGKRKRVKERLDHAKASGRVAPLNSTGDEPAERSSKRQRRDYDDDLLTLEPGQTIKYTTEIANQSSNPMTLRRSQLGGLHGSGPSHRGGHHDGSHTSHTAEKNEVRGGHDARSDGTNAFGSRGGQRARINAPFARTSRAGFAGRRANANMSYGPGSRSQMPAPATRPGKRRVAIVLVCWLTNAYRVLCLRALLLT